MRVAVVVAVLLSGPPALAVQSEVDPQAVLRIKAAKIARRFEIRRELRRIERREAWVEDQQAELAEPYVPPPPSTGMAGLIHDVFGATGADAVEVADCESRLDPTEVNDDSGAAGLFQLMPDHWEGRFDPFDPLANARYAYGLSNGGTDWSDWAEVCRP